MEDAPRDIDAQHRKIERLVTALDGVRAHAHPRPDGGLLVRIWDRDERLAALVPIDANGRAFR